MLLSAEDRLTRARLALDRAGTAPADLLAPSIAESWARCLAAGLDPHRPPPPAMGDAAALHDLRARYGLLRRLGLAEMESLNQQIAGSHFMVALAAPDGMLLETIADNSFQETARASSIRPGMLWGEALRGTNALGTAAFTGKPVMVRGGEHFFPQYGALTCVAAPIFDGAGDVVGILDASSDCHARQRHTSALVGMAATQIGNGLLRERHRDHLLIAFHSRAEFLDTLSAGLLAVDRDGRVLAANARARFLLQSTSGRHFDELFRTAFGAFLHDSRSRDRQRLEDRVGSVYAARLEARGQPRGSPAPQARPAAAAPQTRRAVPRTGFVADDPAVAAAVRQVEDAAARKLPILIYGQTGTGKEQVARHAHAASGRRGGFVPVNCASLTDTLIEAELFGHAEGAFTGARRGGAVGLVGEADGGTLFLDEIGDMKLALQSVLLRLLDDWTVRPVGGGRRREVDVLLIAATNIDLQAAVSEGRFRADLFYRLNTIEITLPPLRDRSDFGAIARRLLAAIDPGRGITQAALAGLGQRPWPGNIRELRSVLTRLALTGAGDIDADRFGDAPAGDAPPDDEQRGDARHSGLRAGQRARIAAVHRQSAGNVSATARRLGVSRNTIYRALAARAP